MKLLLGLAAVPLLIACSGGSNTTTPTAAEGSPKCPFDTGAELNSFAESTANQLRLRQIADIEPSRIRREIVGGLHEPYPRSCLELFQIYVVATAAGLN